MIANQQLCMHNGCMAIQITIRNVPESVRDELAARAARRHQSMQEFLKQELIRIAERPSIDEWMEHVRERKAAADSRVPRKSILKHRDAARR